MDAKQFVQWVTDKSRNLEELYAAELVVEQAHGFWRARKGIYGGDSIDQRIAKQRQRKLNPAYRPTFKDDVLKQAAEMLGEQKSIHWYPGYDDRQIRDISVVRFLPNLESFSLHNSEVTDLTPLTDLPKLKTVTFGGLICDNYEALSRCAHLTELNLTFAVHWPELGGLEKLTGLKKLTLKGNLLAFNGTVTWPNVRIGVLDCTPLAARNVGYLPQLPMCEILTIGGVERLEGIENYPRVMNFTLNGKVRDFSPLAALKELTCFECNAAEPLDVAPLTRLPKLYFASFKTQHEFGIDKARPRDFSPLAEAPQLRELRTEGCKPVVTEVAGINAGLASWDDLFLLPEPRTLGQLKVVVAPMPRINQQFARFRNVSAEDGYDVGLSAREADWGAKFMMREINKKIGAKDWGTVEGNPTSRSINVTVESFNVVEKVGDILETMRVVLAGMRTEYSALLWINLKVPKRKLTKAEKELQEKFEREMEDAEFERRQQEEQEYLERLHRYELKKQEGAKIKPEEFAAPGEKPLALPSDDDDEDDDDDSGPSNVAFKIKKPEPPPSYDDDEDHPLADSYRAMGWMTMNEAWFTNRDQSLVTYMIRRLPDEIIREEEKES